MRCWDVLAEQGNGGRGGFPVPAWLAIGFIVIVGIGVLANWLVKRGR